MDRQLPRSNGIYLERDLISSVAFWALNGAAMKVLMIFFLKRRINKKQNAKNEIKNIENNGEIIFTYLEAQKKYGICKSTFLRARDRLIEVGFIEISDHGGEHHPTKYSISTNWRQYPDQVFTRPKSGNLVGQSTRWKKTTVNAEPIKNKITLNNDTIDNNIGFKSDA